MGVHRKLDGLMSPAEKLARVAAAALEQASSTQTVPSGAVSINNADGTRTVIGNVDNGEEAPSFTIATHVDDETPPGTPTGITATSRSGVVVVEWDGTLAGGIPDDFFCVRVYLDGVELGVLTEAGSVTSATLESDSVHAITATSEDDCCLADGTPAHNVSDQTAAITVTVSKDAETIAVDVGEIEDDINSIEQEISDFKDSVAANYYTRTTTDDKFSTKKEVGAVYNDSMARNLSPFFAHVFDDVKTADNPEGYWAQAPGAPWTQQDDGWATASRDNSEGTAQYNNYFLPVPDPILKEGETFTLMVEVDGMTVTGNASIVVQQSATAQLNPTEGATQLVRLNGEFPAYIPMTAGAITETTDRLMSLGLRLYAGNTVQGNVRLSLYPGEYTGKFKTYVTGARYLATRTWVEQTAESYSINAVQDYDTDLKKDDSWLATKYTSSATFTTTVEGINQEVNKRATVDEAQGYASAAQSGAEKTAKGYADAAERNAMDTASLAPMSTVESGYLTDSAKGTNPDPLTAATASQEVTSAFFNVEAGTTYRLRETCPVTSSQRQWYGYRFYDANGATMGDTRPSAQAAAGVKEVTVDITAPKGAATMRVSMRTFGYTDARFNVQAVGTGLDDYSTTTEMNAAIDNTGDAITNTVKATYATRPIGNPNLSPFFTDDPTDVYNATTNPSGYWSRCGTLPNGSAYPGATITQLEDGWLHVVKPAGSGNMVFAPVAGIDIGSGPYLVMWEFRNAALNANFRMQVAATTYGQLGGNIIKTIDDVDEVRLLFPGDGSINPDAAELIRFNFQAASVGELDVRVSLYECDTKKEEGTTTTIPYDGPYKPYVGGIVYATKTEVKQTATGIDTRIGDVARDLNDEITARTTLIRETADGILVAKVGESIGALVDSSGVFKVVSLTWSDGEPTVGATLSSFSDSNIKLGAGSTATIDLLGFIGAITALNGWLQIGTSSDFLVVDPTSLAVAIRHAGGSSHQVLVDELGVHIGYSGTGLKNVFTGAKVVTFSNSTQGTLFTTAEATSLFGGVLKQSKDVVLICNGNTAAYGGVMTAGINPDGSVRVDLPNAHTGGVQVNYQVTIGA